MRNLEIAKLLRSVAAAYSLKPDDNRFRIIAYERAADAIEHSSSEIKDLWDEGKLDTLAGVGTSLGAHLDELFRTGKVRYFEEVLENLPEAMFDLMDIPGIGPKFAFKLCKELGITKSHGAIEKLEKAAAHRHIRKIEGFGEDSEKKILESIAQWKSKPKDRVILPVAHESAEAIVFWLKQIPQVIRAETLGSLRRWASTVGDIDIAVATNVPRIVLKHFSNYPQKSRLIELGDTTSSIALPNGLQVDLMVSPPSRFGALLQHFTGSKHHNIALREYALKKGLSLSERGIKKGDKLIELATEENFYNAIGLDWIPPELREGNNEINAASHHHLPQLIELSSIKGDLHLHSDFPIQPSHDLGTSKIEEYVQQAEKLKYEYIGFSEHNPRVSQHEEKEILDLVKRKREVIDKLNYSDKKRAIKILNGLEIDIRPNGELALPEKAFDYLDYAIVSIHNGFTGPKPDQTKRVLLALSHPKVKILGHPTGRKLNEREGVDLDWDPIFDLCLKQNKFLEINSYPNRLDLPDVLVHEAISRGVKLIIDTDSHQVETMTMMKFGISVARRGWAQKSDIINTLPLKSFLDLLTS